MKGRRVFLFSRSVEWRNERPDYDPRKGTETDTRQNVARKSGHRCGKNKNEKRERAFFSLLRAIRKKRTSYKKATDGRRNYERDKSERQFFFFHEDSFRWKNKIKRSAGHYTPAATQKSISRALSRPRIPYARNAPQPNRPPSRNSRRDFLSPRASPRSPSALSRSRVPA